MVNQNGVGQCMAQQGMTAKAGTAGDAAASCEPFAVPSAVSGVASTSDHIPAAWRM